MLREFRVRFCGVVAQLGERLNGIQEVRGSIPLSSTIFIFRTCKQGGTAKSEFSPLTHNVSGVFCLYLLVLKIYA